ncbi:RDD family protein [Flavobacterium sp. HJJ]|uniref:RDD family protein n=1 Tax=Flavobacterium sp. HJJ TaxID=2783792 RepID=UPI00188D4196|nr:RDD family protein [Flavobacterium sp. HJJ]MBF4471181.1 RDD family protein [Flavobacterium sp. HJJ]
MSELSINTTQNVIINFKAASVGERMLASLLDFVVKAAYVIVVAYVFFNLLGISRIMDRMDFWSGFAILILFFFPVMIYSVTLESIFEGQTIGKKIVKIKVVKIDGYQASFGDYLIRWLFRIIENNMLGGLIGLVSICISNKTQRMGDMAAGTAIITLKNNISINSTILEEIGETYVPVYPLVIKLSDNDMRIIKETFLTAEKNNDMETVLKLSQKIQSVTGIKMQTNNQIEFIRTILKDYNFYTQNM